MIVNSSAAHRGRVLLAGMALLVPAGAALAGSPTQKAHTPRPPRKLSGDVPLQALVAIPGKVVLRGRYAEARVLIEGHSRDGRVRDVSGSVVLTVADPRVAVVDEEGTVQARGDGRTILTACLKGGGSPARKPSVRIPIEVAGVAQAGPPRFLNDVMPVLTRAGCNQGACHGAASGKGGFKLSLLGYDPESDHESITRAAAARRVSRTQPDNSLLLRKPTLRVAHRGGQRFRVGSPEYRLLRDWIAGGLPGPVASEPRVVRLEVVPPVRALALGQSQRFIVRAHYSDGSQRDATAQTLFTASDETVATVAPNGEAKAVGCGEGAVVIRYQGLVATARVISPFGPPRPLPPTQTNGESEIDRLVEQKLCALGLQPSGPASDSDFLRRATLDTIGLLPTPDEVRAFVSSRDPRKREKLIDSLLERPEYVDFWSLKWGDLLRSSRALLSDKGMAAFDGWIRQSVAENKPWDVFARELLLAQGSPYEEGPANYYRTAGTPQELAETTSQLFLGVRIQCARCHNHPYEKWTQNQYYQMAAFFARVKEKRGKGERERLVFVVDRGEVKHPRTHKEVAPCALDAAPVPASYHGDRRQALAEWLTSPRNPFFAHIVVNRIWSHFMGRGLVEPVDDLRATNPPSNEALFDWLAKDLVAHGYDLKYLIRSIMRSQTYQRSAEPVRGNARDTHYYAHFPFKRLGAEQLLDALSTATGVPEKFDGYPLGMHAEQLPDTGVPSYFLDLFGRPARQIACTCERMDEPNLGQVLHLMNGAQVNSRLSAKTGRVATLVQSKLPVGRIVEELYLASVSRFPTPEESRKGVQLLTGAKNRQQAAEDLMWALLNTKEFVFNH